MSANNYLKASNDMRYFSRRNIWSCCQCFDPLKIEAEALANCNDSDFWPWSGSVDARHQILLNRMGAT